MAKANTTGTRDGELAFWIDGVLIEHYKTGNPSGTWLRVTFHIGGCTYSACAPPVPFEGFDFRSSSDVRFKQAFFDAYYERGLFADKKVAIQATELLVSDESTIYYDDVVITTKCIGARSSQACRLCVNRSR